jgi:carbonic anhydrase
MKQGEPLKIKFIDNSLRIIHENMGKIVTLDGAIYHAQEIVIHTPAEHKIGGKNYDMEVQILHYGMTVGDIAKQVILSFLFEKKAGVYNKFLDDLDIFNLPNTLSKEMDLTTNIFIPKLLFSNEVNGMPAMKPFSFYTYQGSLTAPPCTESTIVYVASQPLAVGTLHLQLLQEALRVPDMMDNKGNVIVSDSIAKSSRDVQPLNGRPVFHYSHEKYCGPDENTKKDQEEEPGHYEKVLSAMTKYFYVSDSKPSGIPGAFVVSEKEALGKEATKISK